MFVCRSIQRLNGVVQDLYVLAERQFHASAFDRSLAVHVLVLSIADESIGLDLHMLTVLHLHAAKVIQDLVVSENYIRVVNNVYGTIPGSSALEEAFLNQEIVDRLKPKGPAICEMNFQVVKENFTDLSTTAIPDHRARVARRINRVDPQIRHANQTRPAEVDAAPRSEER